MKDPNCMESPVLCQICNEWFDQLENGEDRKHADICKSCDRAIGIQDARQKEIAEIVKVIESARITLEDVELLQGKKSFEKEIDVSWEKFKGRLSNDSKEKFNKEMKESCKRSADALDEHLQKTKSDDKDLKEDFNIKISAFESLIDKKNIQLFSFQKLLESVSSMREHQKNYFRTRNTIDLGLAKSFESAVDKMIKQLKK